MKWFKELIKQDVIAFLFLCFILGAGFIWFGTAYGLLRESNADEVSGTVLWLTALAIFWYAYETYQLKKNTTEQILMQETIMQNEFLPILEPVAGKRGPASLRGTRLTGFEVRNLGKGPAKYIELHVGRLHGPLELSLAEQEQKPVQLPVEVRAGLAAVMAGTPDRLSLRLTYQDIYKRKFQTENILFDRSPRGGYTLRQGTWDFKRVRKVRALY